MCIRPYEVQILCDLVSQHIVRCRGTSKMPALVSPPYVPPEHTHNIETLACVIEVLASRLDDVLMKEGGRFDIDALTHSFFDEEG